MAGRLLLLCAMACWAFPPVHATTLRRLDTHALARGSHEIVIARVERVAARWDERRSKIFTDVTLQVSRTLKGRPAERLTLTQLGGEVDGVRVTVHEAPVFTPGEEALVFVWRDARGRAQVNGLAQGKFEIATDPVTGRRTVRGRPTQLGIRDARTAAPESEGAEGASPVPLEDLIREIERALEENGKTKEKAKH